MTSFFFILGGLAFMAMLYFLVQRWRRQPGAGRKALWAFGTWIASTVLLGVVAPDAPVVQEVTAEPAISESAVAEDPPKAEEKIDIAAQANTMKSGCEKRMVEEYGTSLPIKYDGEPWVLPGNDGMEMYGFLENGGNYVDIICIERTDGGYEVRPKQDYTQAQLRSVIEGEPMPPAAAAAPTPATTPEASKRAAGKVISGSNWIGCRKREDFNRVIEFSVQGDKAALGKLLLASDCTFFEDGEEVFLDEVPFLSGSIKVRRPGDLEGYWTNIEAVD